jgi:hypothetical protein
MVFNMNRHTIILASDRKLFMPGLIELEQRILKAKSGEFRLTLVGPGLLLPDTALAMWEILRSRSPGVKLHTHSYSSLMDSDILVWLAGDRRSLRPGAWIHFRQLKRVPKWKQHWMPNSVDDDDCKPEWSWEDIDYACVQKLVFERLPSHLQNRRVWPAELNEWNVFEPEKSVGF